MSAFLAILAESIRLLRARKLFWISFGLSALMALLYLSIGFNERGVSLGFGAFSIEDEMLVKGSYFADKFYTAIFSTYILGIWLTWASNILALISCAPIFPEFMLEGAAGVTLSKPVSRWALFFYKYIGGLLFVFIQTSLFTVVVFIAIRWRLGYWAPSVLLAIPLVTLVFSYLFSIQTLIGVKTRSVMFSILGTILIWMICSMVNGFEAVTYSAVEGGRNPFSPRGGSMSAESKATWTTLNTWVGGTAAILPKTAETTGILNRVIVLKSGQTIQEVDEDDSRQGDSAKMLTRHSKAYIIWTSIGFEAAMLGIAGWIFTRRDF